MMMAADNEPKIPLIFAELLIDVDEIDKPGTATHYCFTATLADSQTSRHVGIVAGGQRNAPAAEQTPRRTPARRRDR